MTTGRNHLLRFRKEEASTGKGVAVGELFSFELAVEVGFDDFDGVLLVVVEVVRVVAEVDVFEFVFVVEDATVDVSEALDDVEDLLDEDEEVELSVVLL